MSTKAVAHPDIAVWIMALGIAFSMALVLTALFNANPWEDHTYDLAPPVVTGMPAPHRDGREKMVCSSCHIVTPPAIGTGPGSGTLPIVQGTPAPHTDGREKMPCASCHTIVKKGSVAKGAKPAPLPAATMQGIPLPEAVSVALAVAPPPTPVPLGKEAHERMVPFRYQGKIVSIAGAGARSVWGDIYIQINDGINPPIWIDLAPRWYLQAEGCVVRPGMFVKGTAFRDPTQASAGLDYAISVMANGEICTLRDNHLNGLWANAGGMDAEER
ncbi:magnetosome protein MamX [Magnetospirillum sp. SS-4]|uniref:magnetosome protein MamX n=1 Tax=Magnetospirillum sp. SS-4 TaxID=2681465 RepID=UPI001384BCC5|nr:magnetosome protein MamX [Magnetospirillum sp. SS-4]CAA7625447.1 conserved hypothetical protein [Magnetospirillum sp. SS-4]